MVHYRMYLGHFIDQLAPRVPPVRPDRVYGFTAGCEPLKVGDTWRAVNEPEPQRQDQRQYLRLSANTNNLKVGSQEPELLYEYSAAPQSSGNNEISG